MMLGPSYSNFGERASDPTFLEFEQNMVNLASHSPKRPELLSKSLSSVQKNHTFSSEQIQHLVTSVVNALPQSEKQRWIEVLRKSISFLPSNARAHLLREESKVDPKMLLDRLEAMSVDEMMLATQVICEQAEEIPSELLFQFLKKSDYFRKYLCEKKFDAFLNTVNTQCNPEERYNIFHEISMGLKPDSLARNIHRLGIEDETKLAQLIMNCLRPNFCFANKIFDNFDRIKIKKQRYFV